MPPDPVAMADPSGARFAEPALVIDLTKGAEASTGDAGAGRTESASARQRASVMTDSDRIVAQGTLIPATLETGIDTTRQGYVRAIVARDTYSFDGSQVLIPRGSRVVGEYLSDVERGQNRTMVTWTRLIRPDGVAIRLTSPASDAQGRAGLRGRVNTHFLERFGGSILQSALGIGTNLAAARIANGAVVIGLPGSLGGGTQTPPGDAGVRPTVRVAAGTAINIFVARDLDFTAITRDQ
jgi:type IV secretion system protein VirB10